MLKKILKPIIHTATGTRKFYYRKLRNEAKYTKGKRILEIGSGKQVNGELQYSAIHIFEGFKEFRQTDINPEFGHEILDITTMDIQNKYDIILCLNVLEHVYETELAITNLHKALKKGGKLFVAVPFMFPLHDEPHDYWRFTEHALTKLFSTFSSIKVEKQGKRLLPFGYFVSLKK